jgi:hypothetical protein
MVDEDDWDSLRYDPQESYSIKAKVNPSDATIKYAVVPDKAPAKIDNPAYQEKIEDLEYTDDSVNINAAGDYYIYAQITKDGYTTCTTFVGFVSIAKPRINVYVNNVEIVEGDTPLLEKQAYDARTNKPIEVDWSEFKFYAAGGTAFEDLKASSQPYLIIAEADNYIINNITGETRIGTIIVKTKSEAQKEADEIINGFKAASTEDELEAAYEAYLAINNKVVKDLVDAAIAKDAELAAKVAAGKDAKDKKDAEAARKAADDAIDGADAYKSDAAVAKAIDDLEAALEGTDTDAIKAATEALNEAVAKAKAAAEEIRKAADDALTAAAGFESDAAVAKAIDDLKATLNGTDTAAIKDATDALNKAVAEAKKAADEAKKAAEEAIKNADAYKTNADVAKAIDALKEALKGDDIAKIKDATKALNDAVTKAKDDETKKDKEAAEAAIKDAEAYKNDPAVAKAISDLQAAMSKGDDAAIKTATAALNNAVAAAKKATPAAKKNASIKIKSKKNIKSFKAKDVKKKAKTVKIKYSKTGDGKVSFKKTKGSKKLSVTKGGKIKVKKGTKKGTYKIKVKISTSATAGYNAASKTKQFVVKVK